MDRKVALPCLATLLYLSTGYWILDMKALGITVVPRSYDTPSYAIFSAALF